jgi:hypothetical protein
MSHSTRRAAVLAVLMASAAPSVAVTAEPDWRQRAAALAPGSAAGSIEIDGKVVPLRHATAARHDAGGGVVYWTVILSSAPVPAETLKGEDFTDFGRGSPTPHVRLDCIDMGGGDLTVTVNVNGGRQALGGVQSQAEVDLAASRALGRVAAPEVRLDVTFHAAVVTKTRM